MTLMKSFSRSLNLFWNMNFFDIGILISISLPICVQDMISAAARENYPILSDVHLWHFPEWFSLFFLCTLKCRQLPYS